jgi:hypothetical protein
MKKIILISILTTLFALFVVNIYAQPVSTDTSDITEKEFNQETYGFQASVKKNGMNDNNGPTVSLHNSLRLERGDQLKIKVNRVINGIHMKNTGKSWTLAVVLFNPARNITSNNVLFRELKNFNDNFTFTFNVNERTIPIIFLMTRKADSNQLAELVGGVDGKDAIINLSSGLIKYSNVLDKIQKYAEITKKLLETPPVSYKTQSVFELRLNQISKIFNIETPAECRPDEIKKQLPTYSLTAWRSKTSECIAKNVDIKKIKINWLALGEQVAGEVKNKYPAIGKWSTEIGIAVDLVLKFIDWYRNRKPQMLFTPARFKRESNNSYRIFTQKSVVVTNADYTIVVMPKPSDNVTLEDLSENMTANFLGEDCFCAGTNNFSLTDNELVSNESVNFFLEVRGKRFPLTRGESTSFALFLKNADIPNVPANEKLKAKIVGEYDGGKKITSNEIELPTSSLPD